jgi:hypothetical protein
MRQTEARQFESNEFFDESLWLLRIDNGAKGPGMKLPAIEEYRGWLESMLLYTRADNPPMTGRSIEQSALQQGQPE